MIKDKVANNDYELKVEDQVDEDEVLVRYDIATYPSDFTLSGIYEKWQNKEITIPDFQREFVWTIRQSSLLIESFLLGLPVPPVFFYIDEENKNLVIDGQQRILSTIFYFEGYFGAESLRGRRQVFRLTGLDSKSPFSNKRFNDLDESDQRKLKGAVLRAINVRQLEPAGKSTSIYHIFERLNTGGTPLRPQEIRNCVFRGDFVKVLRELNTDANWRKIIGKNSFDKHQKDVELVLKIFALSGMHSKYEKPMKEFLNNAMKNNRNATSKNVRRFQELFPKMTKKVIEEFGNKPFHIRGPINTSVLDSVCCTLIDNIDKLPNDLSRRYQGLLKNKEFVEMTTIGTTDTKIVSERFKLVRTHLLD